MTNAEKTMQLYAAEIDAERRFYEALERGDTKAALAAENERAQAEAAALDLMPKVEVYNDFT
jgi:hypothetical protein